MAMTLIRECTDQIHGYLSLRGKSDRTKLAYASDIRAFARHYNLTSDLDQLDLDQLEALAAGWLNATRKTAAPSTTNRRLTAIRTLGRCYGMTILNNYTAPTPMQGRPHPLPGGRNDLEKMFAVADTQEQKALIAFCGLCGLRITEAREREPGHINLIERVIRFIGKGGREREIPMVGRAWEILAPLTLESMAVGRPTLLTMADRTARMTITTMGARAGLSRSISSHDLRATFATEVYRKTKNLPLVQRLLGHGDIKQTQLYIGVSLDEMAEGVNFLDYEDDEDD